MPNGRTGAAHPTVAELIEVFGRFPPDAMVATSADHRRTRTAGQLLTVLAALPPADRVFVEQQHWTDYAIHIDGDDWPWVDESSPAHAAVAALR